MYNLVPITEAKSRLNELVRDAEHTDVVLLRHGHPAAILVGVERHEAILERIEDLEDRLSVYESRESEPALRVPLDKARAELGLVTE